MKLSPKKVAISGAIVAAGVAPIAAMGISSAATPANTNVGTSGIPRTTYHTDRQEAKTEVLGQSIQAIKTARQNKDFKAMVKAKFPNGGYHKALKAQLTKELESQGYSQQQITTAMQHKHLHHLEHKEKKASKTSTNS